MSLLSSVFADAPVPLVVTTSVLLLLFGAFCGWFLIPSARLWLRLRRIRAALQGTAVTEPSELGAIFAVDARLSHLWQEYQDTLHQQTEERSGVLRVIAVRSTVPADAYFNAQELVDSRVHADFFKHLPGIFTGVGIIGTFTGLIGGLRGFQAGLGSEAANALPAVAGLLHEVSRAFLVSGTAIAAAMLVTLVEKVVLSNLYRKTEDIARNIDARFSSGAGEEYLSRIVRASEDSASQAKILKDALVNDLRTVLHEVASLQISSANASNEALATAIAGTITGSLAGPMQEIAGTVKQASGDQSASASRMLQDVLASFSQRLNDLLGDQIKGLSDLNQNTSDSVRQAAHSLQTLTASIEAASQKSGDAMAARMADAMEKMERRQDSINTQTTEFVEQLRQLVATSQSASQQRLSESLTQLGTTVAEMLDAARKEHQRSLAAQGEREAGLAERTTVAVGTMTGSVEGAVTAMATSSQRMQEAVSVLTQATSSTLDRMNYGADTLLGASRSFAEAGDRVTGVIDRAATVATKLSELAGALTSSSSALQRAVADYGLQRDAIASLVGDLKEVVAAARTEASLTTDVLARLEAAAQKLAVAQGDAERYLEQVSKVLAEAHSAFADATRRTLESANSDFHSKLSTAVHLLSSTIQEFDTTVAGIRK